MAANETTYIHQFDVRVSVNSNKHNAEELTAVDIRAALLHGIVTISDEDLLKASHHVSTKFR